MIVNLVSFSIEKKHIKDSVEATGKLSKQISSFFRSHYDEFLTFDDVKIYYDNGQVEVSNLFSKSEMAQLHPITATKTSP